MHGVHLKLPNGITLSIQQSTYHYCTVGETVEVGAWDKDENWIRLGEDDNVVGHQTADDIVKIITKLSAMEFSNAV